MCINSVEHLEIIFIKWLGLSLSFFDSTKQADLPLLG